MARLHLKYGLVAPGDRLSSSADSLAVTEPATGSRTRTKGNLYVVVSSSSRGGRWRDATLLVADTIRREYYYDESAGIPICLEKAFRSAERKVRDGRVGQGVTVGSIGVAVAVIRGSELYVATTGPVEAYLVRAARLLMPEHARGPGIPAGEDLRVGVWRGEFAIGDSLLLVARDLTEVVGTEELKNAIVTLHPQSAVEHLHHLFVAAGGEGSDAVLAIEASEAASVRAEHRLVPVAIPEGASEMPEPAATGGGFATSAFATRAIDARDAMGDAVASLGERLGDLVPGRRRQYRPLTPRVSQREAQRRAAVAFLAFLGVILVVGLAVAFFPPGREDSVDRIKAGEAAFTSARDLADQASELIVDDPTRARDLLREAWQAAGRAQETGVPAAQVGPVRERIATGLDTIYGTTRMEVSVVARVDAGGPHDPRDLILGPDGAAYVLDDEARTVTRVDLVTGASVVVVTAGDGGGEGIGTPEMLAVGAADLLIVDDRESLWRWRPSDDTGRGTLLQIAIGGEVAWGDDIIDVGTFLQPGQEEDGLYNLYVADPSSSQILRYQPTQDGGSFPAESSYLVADDAAVAQFRELLIDGDIYALTATDARRYETGQQREFVLEVPPDDGDVRPGREFALVESTGPRGEGSLYVWDGLHGRLLVYDKSDGSYVQQWLPVSSAPSLSDLRGMFIVVEEAPVVPEGSASPEPSAPTAAPAGTLYWLTADALYRSELIAVEDEPVASPLPSPSVRGTPSDEPIQSAEPTRRPRRTPRVTP